MSCDNLSNDEHSKNGRAAMNEINMLAEACKAMTYMDPEDKNAFMHFLYGAESVLERASDHVCGLVERFEGIVKASEQSGREG